jgi:uncharacterized protein
MNADQEEVRSQESEVRIDSADAAEVLPEPKPELSRDPTLVGPVTGDDRIYFIDLLRGMALFGILAANMRAFFAPLSVYGDINSLYTKLPDKFAQAFIDIFIQGKFVTLFSFLFGLGFAVQFTRAEAKGVRFLSFYPRRLGALALFGVIHGIAIWAGDILLTYAITGALLLAFRNRKPVTLLWWAGGIPALFVLGISLATIMQPPTQRVVKPRDLAPVMHTIEVYAHGSFGAIMREKWHDWVNFSLGAQFAAIYCIILFLLGLYVWRSGIVTRLVEHLPILRRVRNICIPVGLALNGLEWAAAHRVPDAVGSPTFFNWISNILSVLAAPVLSAGYAAGLAVLITQSPKWRERLRPFAAIGRMALTNYLTQSIVCTLFFYHYITGTYGKWGPLWGLLFTVILYGLQVPFSNWWLSRYRFGPMEWIWRGLTYGKLPAMRREPVASAQWPVASENPG